MKYDTIQEVGVAKTFDQVSEVQKNNPNHNSINDSINDSINSSIDRIVEVTKFNPFHDKLGRFANKNGFSTYSANPKTTSGAKAISRSVDYKHGATINVHHESQGKTLDENAYWLKTGQKMPTADEPKQTKPAKKPNPAAETDGKQETPTKTKAFGNSEIQNGHEFYDKYGSSNSGNAAKAIMEATKCSKQEAIKVLKTMSSFTGIHYEDIRAVQTGKKKEGSYNYAKYKQEGDTLEGFIKASPKWDGSGTLYRGIDVDNKVAAKIIKDATTGAAINQKGTASWSSEEGVAKGFAHWGGGSHDTTSILFVMNGGSMKGTSIKHLSEFSSENEILMSKRQKVKASNVTKTAQGYIVECVELP